MTAEATAPVPERCNATDVFKLSSYIDRLVCCNNTYLAGKFVSLGSKEILVRKFPAMNQGADCALWPRRAWPFNLQIDLHRDGGPSALDRAAKQHKRATFGATGFRKDRAVQKLLLNQRLRCCEVQHGANYVRITSLGDSSPLCSIYTNKQ